MVYKRVFVIPDPLREPNGQNVENFFNASITPRSHIMVLHNASLLIATWNLNIYPFILTGLIVFNFKITTLYLLRL